MNELATTVETASTLIEQTKGLSFRDSFPPGHALVFENVNGHVPVHTLGMRFPIDVLWVEGARVTKVETLRPWVGFGYAPATQLIELPAGTCENVEPGDWIAVKDGTVKHEHTMTYEI